VAVTTVLRAIAPTVLVESQMGEKGPQVEENFLPAMFAASASKSVNRTYYTGKWAGCVYLLTHVGMCCCCYSEGIFTNPQDGSEMTCQAFQDIAYSGVIKESDCALVPSVVSNCGCEDAPAEFANPPCNVCGNGKKVTKP
jgi:hypothetical protein